MGKCPQSISSILTHQEHNSFFPVSLNLSKNFIYTLGEEGWGLKDRGGKGRGLKDGSSKARSWGRSSTQACGEQGNRGPDIATCFSPGSFLSKPNLIGDHDKDTIRTIKRLPFYIFFPQFTLRSTPSSKCPVSLFLILPTHKQGNHRRGCLQHGGEEPAGINFNLARADKRLGVVCLGLPASLTAPFI